MIGSSRPEDAVRHQWIRTSTRLFATAVIACAALAPAAAAAPIDPVSTPQSLPAGAPAPPSYIGAPAARQPIRGVPRVPRNRFMAANGRSNIHDDPYMTDSYTGSGPLGRNMTVKTTYFPPGADCASVTFDRRGRIESVCVGLPGTNPVLRLFDRKLRTLASYSLPVRGPSTNPFQDFSGGGYFFLDNRDRAVVPTSDRHIYVISSHGSNSSAYFTRDSDYDLNSAIASTDKITSVLPDSNGLLWFVTLGGVVGTIDQSNGTIQKINTGEQIENSFAVDEDGGVYIVTDVAMYRFGAAPDGTPQVTWREVYENSGIHKPSQINAGSGTTPTVMAGGMVAITDNADPMNVVVYKRAPTVSGNREVCHQPVFSAGASATENSLLAAGNSLIVENNYGYESPLVTTVNGLTTAPGIERVDVDPANGTCQLVWHSSEIAPSVVPKVSLGNGLIYTYTKPADPVNLVDPWYLTAIDFRTGATRWSQLTGTGFYFNNNYAPISIAPDRSLYSGMVGGLVQVRDGR